MKLGIVRIKNAIITIRRSYIRYSINFISELKIAKISQFANCGRLSKERVFPVMKRATRKNVNIFRGIGAGRQDSIHKKDARSHFANCKSNSQNTRSKQKHPIIPLISSHCWDVRSKNL